MNIIENDENQHHFIIVVVFVVCALFFGWVSKLVDMDLRALFFSKFNLFNRREKKPSFIHIFIIFCVCVV